MRRREFLAGLGAAAWPLTVWAQPIASVRRVGVLVPGSRTDTVYTARVDAFKRTLTGLGWADDRNIWYEERYSAESSQRRLCSGIGALGA